MKTFIEIVKDEKYNSGLTFKDFMEICTGLELPVFEYITLLNPFQDPHVSTGLFSYPGIEEFRNTRMPYWAAREYDYENDRATSFYKVPEISTGEFDIFALNSSTSYKWHFIVLSFAVVVHSTETIID